MVGPSRHRKDRISDARRFFGFAQFGAGGDKNLGCRRIAALDLPYRYTRCDRSLADTVAVMVGSRRDESSHQTVGRNPTAQSHAVVLHATAGKLDWQGSRTISGRYHRFGGTTDLSGLRSGSPNKVRAEGSFDRIRALRNPPYPEDTIRTIRSVVAHELALMLIRAI